MGDRTKITDKEYAKAIEEHGDRCKVCGNNQIEMHHVKFRSHSGKGTYRNLRPLCNLHHTLVHSSTIVCQTTQNLHESLYGQYYWCDRFDIYLLGLIENPTEEEFESFMESQEAEWVEPVYDTYQFPF